MHQFPFLLPFSWWCQPAGAAPRPQHLWMLELKTKKFRQFTNSPKAESQPKWSPDSKTLAYVTGRSGSAPISDGTIFILSFAMREQIDVRGIKFWILIEPHTHPGHEQGQPQEYFTASYSVDDSTAEPAAILFLETSGTPKCFESPVQALEYASEKLLGVV